MRLTKLRAATTVAMTADNEHIIFYQSMPVAFKDRYGQWFRLKPSAMERHANRILALHLHRAKVTLSDVTYIEAAELREIVEAI